MNIGILYPRSGAYPQIAKEFLDGIKTYFKKQGISDRVKLFSESVGYGALEKEVYEKTEKLLLLEEVDIVVGFIDLKVIELLQPLLQSSGKVMLVVNPGANVPENWVAQPNFFFLTLQHAFLCWLTGAMAAEEIAGKGVLVSNFYDCGYGHTSTMVNSYIHNGGEICYNFINRQLPGEVHDIKILTDFLKTDDLANNLLCLNNSEYAVAVYKQLKNADTDLGLKLFVSPMMLENDALTENKKESVFSVKGYIPWLSVSTEKANTDFKDFYLAETQKEATIFSLLGWEAAMILEQILLNSEQAYNNTEAVTSAITEKVLNSPRGNLKLDIQTNYFTAPFVKCNIKSGQSFPEYESVLFSEDEWQQYIQLPTEGSASGWKNTYLCY